MTSDERKQKVSPAGPVLRVDADDIEGQPGVVVVADVHGEVEAAREAGHGRGVGQGGKRFLDVDHHVVDPFDVDDHAQLLDDAEVLGHLNLDDGGADVILGADKA